jgi:ribonucleoside-diphosphate reductase alpha chain
VNLPENARPEDIKRIYQLAWKLKCKGITIYRYGSKGPTQVLNLAPDVVKAESEYSGGKCEGETCF